MNYIHNIIKTFMKDHGIKPFEKFKIGELSTGWFDNEYNIHNEAKSGTEKVLFKLLNNEEDVEMISAFLPEKDDIYYYFREKNPSHPELLTICQAQWMNTLADLCRHRSGNCFRSQKEAYRYEKIYDKYIKEYTDFTATTRKKNYAKVS